MCYTGFYLHLLFPWYHVPLLGNLHIRHIWSLEKFLGDHMKSILFLCDHILHNTFSIVAAIASFLTQIFVKLPKIICSGS